MLNPYPGKEDTGSSSNALHFANLIIFFFIFTDSEAKAEVKCSGVHAVISMTESSLFLMLSCLRAQRIITDFRSLQPV